MARGCSFFLPVLSRATSHWPQLCSCAARVQGMARGCEGRQYFPSFSLGSGWGGMGGSLLFQDKVTPTQAIPLLSIFRSGFQGPECCLSPSVTVRTIVWKRKQGSGVHRPAEGHLKKGLPLSHPFNNLSELELSSSLGWQCFLESLAGRDSLLGAPTSPPARI